MEQIVEVLKRTPLFCGIEPEKIAGLCRDFGCFKRSYHKGNLLWQQGEEVRCAGVVLSGCVQAEKSTSDGSSVLVARHGVGSLFGDILMSSQRTESPVDIVAAEDAQVLFLPFEHMMREGVSPEREALERFRLNLLGEMSEKYWVLHRKLGYLSYGFLCEFNFKLVEAEKLFILLYDSVAGLCENIHKRLHIKRVEAYYNGNSAHKLGNKTVLHNIVRRGFLEKAAFLLLCLALDLAAEANALLTCALAYDFLKPVESTAADKEYILRIYLNKFLLGVLSAALRWHVCYSALKYLEQRLLHALAGNVARDRTVFALA